MNSLILRTVTRLLMSLMLVFSVFILLRGHNEPGGGFIGGLVAVSAFAIYGIAYGVQAVRRAMWIDSRVMLGIGLGFATVSGLLAALTGTPFLTGQWLLVPLGVTELKLSSVLIFDIGVYLVVVGAIITIVLPLEED